VRGPPRNTARAIFLSAGEGRWYGHRARPRESGRARRRV